jgi:hypothetical protein
MEDAFEVRVGRKQNDIVDVERARQEAGIDKDRALINWGGRRLGLNISSLHPSQKIDEARREFGEIGPQAQHQRIVGDKLQRHVDRLTLVKGVSPQLELWLITFDKNKFRL